jgi:hypothetical protein
MMILGSHMAFSIRPLQRGDVTAKPECRLASFTGMAWRLRLKAKRNRDLPKSSITCPCSVCSLAAVKAATSQHIRTGLKT